MNTHRSYAAPKPPGMNMGIIQSKGLFSNWFFDRPNRTLIDCGEGCANALDKEIFAVERILFTHEHTDHIAGLPSFINLRNMTIGDNTKPLEIFYPANSTHLEFMREFIAKTQKHLTFPLIWHPITLGHKIPVANRRFIQTFATKHSNYSPSLGYLVSEERNQLRQQYMHLSKEQIQKGIAAGQLNPQDLQVPYTANIMAHTGDAYWVDAKAIKEVDTLIVDGTFLRSEDTNPKSQTHFSIDQIISLAKDANVKHNLIVQHVSTRYSVKDIESALEKLKKALPNLRTIFLLKPGQPYTLHLDQKTIHLAKMPFNPYTPVVPNPRPTEADPNI